MHEGVIIEGVYFFDIFEAAGGAKLGVKRTFLLAVEKLLSRVYFPGKKTEIKSKKKNESCCNFLLLAQFRTQN